MYLSKRCSRILALLVFYCFNISFAAQISSRDSTRKLNLVVKTDVLLPVIGLASGTRFYSFTLEKLFCERQSIQVTYLSSRANNTPPMNSAGYASNEWNTFLIIPEYKYFISKKKQFTDYYIGGFGIYSQYHDLSTLRLSSSLSIQNEEIVEGIGGGFINGVQFYPFKYIAIDVLLGAGYINPIKYRVIKGSYANNQYNTFIWRAAINVGFKF